MKRSLFRRRWFPGRLRYRNHGCGASAQQIAFTWDDLPSHSALPPGETRVEIGKKIVAAMKDAKMPPVYGFVNGVRSEDEPLSMPMLKDWRDAGLPLGNHTWSHMNLNQASVEDWEADVLKNEAVLKSYMGDADWHWLRYPNLAEGNARRSAMRRESFWPSMDTRSRASR